MDDKSKLVFGKEKVKTSVASTMQSQRFFSHTIQSFEKNPMMNHYSRPDEAGNVVNQKEPTVSTGTIKPKNSNKKYMTMGGEESKIEVIDNKEYKESLNHSINTRLNNNI